MPRKSTLIGLLPGLLLITLLTLFWPAHASAAPKIVVLQSVRIKPYDEALAGVKSTCNGVYKKFVVSDLEGSDIVRLIRQERPDVIVAIGTEALIRVKKIRETPIVYLMALGADHLVSGHDNISGISFEIPPEKQLVALQSALPNLRRIGLVYNQAKSCDLYRKAQAAARALGIELIEKEVSSPRSIPSAMEQLKGHIDAFWMIPDTTVVSPTSFEYLALFSLNHKVPILAFSDKYVEMGAFISVDADAVDIGRQAGELINKITTGASARVEIPLRNTTVTINAKIARKLGITLGETALQRARIIR